MKKVVADIVAGLPGKRVSITKGKGIGTLTINVPFKIFEVREVSSIDWQEKAERSGGKAAAGAIIGGLAVGGLGAIAGAAIGGKKRDTSTAVLNTNKGQVLIRCGSREFTALQNLLNNK